jgi:hypothetical protein
MLASTFQDAGNQLHVAHSLAELYIDDLRNVTEGRVWLEHFGKQLDLRKDTEYLEDYQRLRNKIDTFRG